jgi:2-dehydro-3-deoxyphosphogluconate aldolase/(4S)-4-hydroxy-2-oxoglutarate aldolase
MGKITDLMEGLKKTRLIPLVTIPDPELAVPLAQALIAGGVNWLEITFRNDLAEEGLKKIHDAKLPIHIGAGTVRTVYQVQKAYEAGAEFLITPGFNDAVSKFAQKHKIPIFPGVDSTLGIEQAQDLGLSVLKFFPAAEAGGIGWLKAIQGPYYDIQFIPTGGINFTNLADYLALKNVIAVGGSFLAPNELIKEKKFDQITALAKKACDIASSIKK